MITRSVYIWTGIFLLEKNLIAFLLRREKNKQICCHRLRGHPSFLKIASFHILAVKLTHDALQIGTGIML